MSANQQPLAVSIIKTRLVGAARDAISTENSIDVSLIKVSSLSRTAEVDSNLSCNHSGITEGRVKTLGAIDLDFVLPNFSISHSLQVVASNFPIPTCGILGSDFVWRFACTFCTFNKTFTIRYKGSELTLRLDNQFDSEIWVPPRSEVIREIDLNLKEDAVIKKGMPKPDVLVAGSIVSKQNCFVRIVNINTEMKRVRVDAIKFDPLTDFSCFKTQEELDTVTLDKTNQLTDFGVMKNDTADKDKNFTGLLNDARKSAFYN